GDVVENHVGGRSRAAAGTEAEGAFALVAAVAAIVDVSLTEANVAANDVVPPIKRNFGAHDANAAAGSGLSRDGQPAAARDGRLQLDVAAPVDHDDASALAHGVAKGSRTAVGECGHVIDRAAAAACGVFAEAHGAGKCERLCGRSACP